MELLDLCKKMIEPLSDYWRKHNYYSYNEIEELNIEFEDYTICIHAEFDVTTRDRIEKFNILDIFIQFADFEATISKKYILQIEKMMNDEQLIP